MAAPAHVRIAIGPSRILAAVLGIAHGVALAALGVTAVPTWLKAVMGTALGLSCAWSVYSSALLRGRRALVELVVAEDGGVWCRARNGTEFEARLLDSSFVSPWMTVLNLRTDGEPRLRHMILVPDNVAPDAFRRLRVLLRWSRRGAQAHDGPSDPANSRG
jgi:toxin CptA